MANVHSFLTFTLERHPSWFDHYSKSPKKLRSPPHLVPLHVAWSTFSELTLAQIVYRDDQVHTIQNCEN